MSATSDIMQLIDERNLLRLENERLRSILKEHLDWWDGKIHCVEGSETWNKWNIVERTREVLNQ